MHVICLIYSIISHAIDLMNDVVYSIFVPMLTNDHLSTQLATT